jgi:hypothetical protein
MSIEATDFTFTGVSGGFVGVNTSVRAPIFYDSENTAFFVDPNSTSVLSTIRANRVQFSNSNTAIVLDNTSYQILYDPTGRPALYIGGADPANYYDNTNHYYRDRGGVQFGIISASGVYGSRFYDINDTAYYIDPTVTSNLNDLIITRNIASPSNYYNDLQLEVQATSGTAGIGLHRAGYSHCGIYHDSVNQLKFNFNNGTVTLNHNAGSLIGTGNDETYIRLREAVTSEDWNSYIDGAEASYRIVTNATGPNRAGAYNYGVLLSMANAGQAKFQLYAPHNGTDGNGIWVRTGWDGDYDAWNEMAIQSRSFTNNVDLRAPLFYDSNNTSYYVDPASGSVLGGNVSILGGRNIVLSTSTGSIQVRGDAGGWSIGTLFYGSSGTYRGGFGALGGTDGLSHYWIGNDYNNAGLYVYPSNYAESSGSLRAPIFYDSNNTGFYIDPAGTSTIGNLRTGNVINMGGWNESIATTSFRGIEFHNEGGRDYYIGKPAGAWTQPLAITFYTGIHYRASQDYGGSKFYNANNGSMLFSIGDNDGSVRVTNDIRSPIYYDSNDTGYYVDAHSTSNLNILNVLGGNVVRGDSSQGRSTNSGNMNSLSDPSGFFYASGPTGAPNAEWYNWINCIGNAWGGTDRYGFQIAHQFWNEDQLYVRRVQSGGWQTWRRIFTEGSVDVRAPIFYDRDNPAFFLDPNATGTSLNVAGSIVAAGNVTAYSDIRIKANVETIPSALNKIDQIRGVTYTRTDLDDKEQRYAGVIAQEIEAVLPEAVRDLGNIKAVDYNATIALLIQAVKELRDEVEMLRK